MPRNTGAGVILAGLSVVLRRGAHLVHLVAGGCELHRTDRGAIAHTFNYDRDFHIASGDVTRVEDERTRLLAASGQVG